MRDLVILPEHELRLFVNAGKAQVKNGYAAVRYYDLFPLGSTLDQQCAADRIMERLRPAARLLRSRSTPASGTP